MRTVLLSLVTLLAIGCPKATELPSAQAAVPAVVSPFAVYELSALTGQQQQLYQEVTTTAASPCEQPETLAACSEAKRCGQCLYLSRVAYRLVRDNAGQASQIASYLEDLAKTQQNNAKAPLPTERILQNSPARGSAAAKVSVVEFADFECPYCAKVHAELYKIEKQLDTVARFYFKNFPLSMHPNAEPAARAALAAGQQGKFWEYHHLLFVRQSELMPSRFSAWAEELGLDKDRFLADYTSPAITAQVAADRQDAVSLGIDGTPVLLIDGQPYLDIKTADAILDAVLFAAAEKGAFPFPSAPK